MATPYRAAAFGCLGLLALAPVAHASPQDRDEAPRYSRHVAPLFSKLGCNGGACHGAVKGQNGFRLTLFGADPALDHERLVREISGRRLNFIVPQNSLLLLKATGEVAHGGGKRTEIGSPEFNVLRRWIAAGAPLDNVDKSRLKQLTITPSQHTAKPGESYRLKVEATFADGSRADVTQLCSYETMDKAVAVVDRDGNVRVNGPG